MKKIICFFTIFVFWGITDSMAQGLHFGVKAGVLGNKANISGMRDQFKEESLTGFQVGPMLQYQTGFHGIALDFSLLYVERGIKLTNTSNRRSADIKTQSIDIPIELKWEMGISNNFDLFLGVGPSFSFLVDKDNWGRKLAHIAVDVIDYAWQTGLILYYNSNLPLNDLQFSLHLPSSIRLQSNAIP